MLTVKVEGYADAKRILDELPDTMQKRMLNTALRMSAKPMLQSARSKVPVRTGKLKKQLRIVRYKDRNAPKSEVSIAVKPVFERTKKKGAINEYYGKFIHEGTKDPRTSKKGKLLVFENEQGEKVFTRSVKGIKATPFLEQAYTQDKELISILEREISELRDKIQAGAVDERTAAPFAAFSTPEETPVRTMHGIAGYVTAFEITVYDKRVADVEQLKHRIIAALEGQVLTDRRCSFKSASTDYYPDYDIHGVTLTFRIV